MRNIILLAHVSLDGYVAGPNGDMSFITFNDEIAAHVHPLIDNVTTSIYGRTTYQMMEGYWPDMVDNPKASEGERKHARWYMGVEKIVASRTLAQPASGNTRVIADNIPAQIAALKQQPGGDIMIFTSATLTHTLAAHDLIDEWRLQIQPVVLGRGLPLYTHVERPTKLELRSTKTFSSGVIATHYVTRRTGDTP